MKYSSVFALTLCGALAFALVGCKYDNPETDNGQIGVAEIPTTGEDPSLKGINGIDVSSDQAPGTMPAAAVNPNGVDKDAEVSSLAQATGRARLVWLRLISDRAGRDGQDRCSRPAFGPESEPRGDH